MFEKCFTTGWLSDCLSCQSAWALGLAGWVSSSECVSINETNLGKVSLRILIVAKCWTLVALCVVVCLAGWLAVSLTLTEGVQMDLFRVSHYSLGLLEGYKYFK